MHDGMQYDPIQGQGQGHEPFKVGNPVVFKSYLLCHLPVSEKFHYIVDINFAHWRHTIFFKIISICNSAVNF